ncbi:MAG TPA: hypothetical protein PLS94_01135 [Prolixibacteraceae bacterium]|nr:hypothetical protein [Prolixibacteraceae bacterium]HPR60274.1 hypothetical protein [Prolixibacteraceae bacterium]
MNLTENIEYQTAQIFFEQAERNGLKLIPGNLDANLWLHKENINLDFVIETAKQFNDSRIFIISKGLNKGFYIYSKIKQNCLKLISSSVEFNQPVSV